MAATTTAQEQEMYDQMLMQLAGRHNGIESLLKTIFTFFHRKTDLYLVANKEQNNMGFPSGIAEKLVLRAFRSLPMKDISKIRTKQGLKNPTSTDPRIVELEAPSAPASSLKNMKLTPPNGNVDNKKVKPTTSAKKEKPSEPDASAGNTTAASASSTTTTSKGKGSSASGGTTSASNPPIRYNDKGQQIPIGNGGICEKYFWTQNLNELTVYIDVPEGTRAKEVNCKITSTKLKIGLKGQEPIIDGDLGGKAKVDSLWTLESNKMIVITLDKCVETWWKSVIKGDPEIDTQQVDSTRKVHEYDSETQGAIRKIMFDQHQKQLGLPTSDDMEKNAILEKAKNLPGSPFL